MRFRALLTVGAMLSCGLVQMYAGNGPSKPISPDQEIAAIQYNKSGQLRTDFTGNRTFVKLLLKAHNEGVKFWAEEIDKRDWRPAVKAYHAAFEELKRCLQGKWGRIFGYGPSRFPWNGHSDRAIDLWREDDLRRDMPVVLSFWDSGIFGLGHICPTTICYKTSGFSNSPKFYVFNNNREYVPRGSSAYLNQGTMNRGKEQYKAYVLKFFNKSSLSKCKEYLRKFFSVPVSDLLGAVCDAVCNREDLQLLLNLYADYYSLDAVAVDNNRGCDGEEGYYEGFGFTTSHMVQLMVTCYLTYEKWSPEDKRWLCSLLDNLDANYYMKENLHTYCIQSHHLLKGYTHTKCTGILGVGWSTTECSCKGLVEAFEKLGYNPLPKETWLKFVNYAGRRLSLVRETESWSEQPKGLVALPPVGPNNANTVLHLSETFDQVPCAKEVLEEMSWPGETGIEK